MTPTTDQPSIPSSQDGVGPGETETEQPEPTAQQLDAGVVFDAGWVTAANWASRADLISDMDSDAYKQDKTSAIRALYNAR